MKKIAITGASGLVGAPLVAALQARGERVIRLVRRAAKSADEVRWDPATGVDEPHQLEGLDALIHLAGENIAARRWSDKQKARIRDSRVQGTTHLVASLAKLERPPAAFLSASAVGFYGATGTQEVDETDQAGSGFLPEVCVAWEQASQPLEQAGVRVAHLRFGVILSPAGGALAKMLLPFKMGVGGVVGSGLQGMSWVSLRDAVQATLHVLDRDSVRGPVNVVAPAACSNRDFTRALGRVLRRPTVLPMPSFAARLAFGELADDLLLASLWVRPRVLERSGFHFQDPDIDAALGSLLREERAA